MDTLNLERVQRAYERINGVPTQEEWYEIVIGADGTPVLRLHPAAAVLYAERPDARIHPDDLDVTAVAHALGLHPDYIDGFGSAYLGADDLEALKEEHHEVGDVAEFERGYRHGQRVRALIFEFTESE